MTSPTKPWETSANYQRFDAEKDLGNQSSAPPVFDPSGGVTTIRGVPSPTQPLVTTLRAVPPLPPRPSFHSRPGGYSVMGPGQYPPSYNRMYSGMSRSYGAGYGGGYGSGYSNYGNYGMPGYSGIAGYGHSMQNIPESRLVQMAEESSRPAFESIESLVRAFGSISFMLETTYDTIYNSFRAVLDVAENVGRMRNVFSQIFSAFGIIRALQWLYRKALSLLGFTSNIKDQLWNEAASSKYSLSSAEREAINKKTSWGGLLLMAILFSGPYILWKLMNSLNLHVSTPHDYRQWLQSPNILHRALTLYEFEATTDQELSFKPNIKLLLAPREYQTMGKNWLLAYSSENKKYGFIPSNYIRITETIKTNANAKHTTSPQQGIYPQTGTPGMELKKVKEQEKSSSASLGAKPAEPLLASPSTSKIVLDKTPDLIPIPNDDD